MVKNTFSFKEYYLKDNLYSQVKYDYNILSTWRNEREYDNSFDYIYYYMIHPINLNYSISICTPSETIFAEMTNKTELLWMNSKKSYFEYTTSVLAFFEDKEGEHFYAYQSIHLISYKFQIWILISILSFVAVFVLVGLVTCLMYKQIKVVQIEDENSEDIEILDQSNCILFPEN